MGQLINEINWLCREYERYSRSVENRGKAEKIRKELAERCEEGRKEMGIEAIGVLLALLDAYEVTRDEGMLQEVLDVVGGNMECLEVSAESVKLLAYCYHYVEEDECAERAKEMLNELKGRGEDTAELEKELVNLL